MMIYTILDAINFIFQALSYMILIRAILSWFVSPGNSVCLFIDRMFLPIMKHIRKLPVTYGGMDFSYLALYFILIIMIKVINFLFINFFL